MKKFNFISIEDLEHWSSHEPIDDDNDGAPEKEICARCYREVDWLYPPKCSEDPVKLTGQPIGMYHCPECGTMVLAGLPHPFLCKKCVS